jgi:hypothetical protein
MRKRILGPGQVSGRLQSGQAWLDLEHIATIEVTSEEPIFPIESVLAPKRAQNGALLKKAYNRSGSSLINPLPYAAFSCIFLNPSVSALRNSAFDGHPQRAAVKRDHTAAVEFQPNRLNSRS